MEILSAPHLVFLIAALQAFGLISTTAKIIFLYGELNQWDAKIKLENVWTFLLVSTLALMHFYLVEVAEITTAVYGAADRAPV